MELLKWFHSIYIVHMSLHFHPFFFLEAKYNAVNVVGKQYYSSCTLVLYEVFSSEIVQGLIQ